MVKRRPGYLTSIEAWERAEGAAAPLGAAWIEEHQSYNFALYSRHATGVTLLLYNEHDFVNPVYQRQLDHLTNKTGRVWHCWVPAAEAPGARYYAYRVDGPHDPAAGDRFDASKILLDPCAHEVFFPPGYERDAASRPGPNDGRAPLGVLPGHEERTFDWSDDRRTRHTHDAIVYELHVKGFTARANSGVSPEKRGNFAGLVEKIPYLQ